MDVYGTYNELVPGVSPPVIKHGLLENTPFSSVTNSYLETSIQLKDFLAMFDDTSPLDHHFPMVFPWFSHIFTSSRPGRSPPNRLPQGLGVSRDPLQMLRGSPAPAQILQIFSTSIYIYIYIISYII